ncbi:hypothetical protein OV760_29295, partial [Salmonella enterica subsp. enterica serovar 1,4,[5],12:i:-]|nr:hypothetical protein [Salmonella enterica subsp. enterica serovar 1,4,[5],12:i:-]
LVANTTSGVQRYGILPIHIIRLPPIPKEDNKTYGYLEKMWAYKTIKTLLDKNIVSKNDSLGEKAKELSLKYSFVTPLTSLIVVKPNDSSVVDENKNHGPGYGG